MIIWLASYPRSGNTYFRMLLNHIYGIKTRSVYDDPLLANLKGSSELVGHELLNGSLEDLDQSKEFFLLKRTTFPRTTDQPSRLSAMVAMPWSATANSGSLSKTLTSQWEGGRVWSGIWQVGANKKLFCGTSLFRQAVILADGPRTLLLGDRGPRRRSPCAMRILSATRSTK